MKVLLFLFLLMLLVGCNGKPPLQPQQQQQQQTPPVGKRPSITTERLSDATVDKKYQEQLNAKDGVPPYHWRLSKRSGPLPPGLALNEATGEIAGKPSAEALGKDGSPKKWVVEIEVEDSHK